MTNKALATVVLGLAATGCASVPDAGEPHVILVTDLGDIVIAADIGHAPISACNFLRYVAAGDYDDGTFFRTVVAATNDNPNPIDVSQAATPRGSDDASHPPVTLERTRDTGLSHVAGAVSLARDGPDTATSSFFVVLTDTPSLDFGGDRNPDGQGFAAFGRIVEGFDVAQAIHRLPAEDEQITPPVRIVSARVAGGLPDRCRGDW